MKRSNAREIVAHLVFKMNFTDDCAEKLIESTMEPAYYGSLAQESDVYSQRPDEAQMAYICAVSRGIEDHREQLDGFIEKYAINWSVNRISKVARAILHVAMYESLYVEDVPVSSAINEAVELARKYEDEDVVSFVNGILGSFSRDMAL